MAISTMESHVDILIVGAGPAGLLLATQLSKLKLNVRIIDKAAHPVLRGHADGLQCRTGEVFHALDVGTRFEEEACECAETVTYTQDLVTGKLVETARQPDTLPGTSLARHVLLGQDRVEAIFIEAMKKNDNLEVERLLKPVKLEVDADIEHADPSAYPVHVTLESLSPPKELANGDIKSGLYRSNLFANGENGTNGTNGYAGSDEEPETQVVHCKYLVGCDGAHSWVRKQLGFEMRGDSANIFWGCFDAIIETDLPTIRTKNLINLTHGEGVRMIPREKGLVRVYTQMGTVSAGERVDRSQVTIDKLMAKTKEALYPFKLDFRRIDWYSCYEVGQRLCDTFSKYNRIFIAGDACHTHSPRAGQGMNVSMMDTFNLGWKLASVIRQQASPEILRTYQLERRAVASDLIGMHGVWSEINAKVASARGPEQLARATDEFRQAGLRMAKFVSGTGIVYSPSVLVDIRRMAEPSTATGLKTGSHFENRQVVCVSNLHAVQLQRRLKADGRWRIILFPGDIRKESIRTRFEHAAKYLDSSSGPVRRYTPAESDTDTVIECLTVVSGDYRYAQAECLRWPEVLRPIRGELRVTAFDTVFADCTSYHNGHGKAYEGYGIDEETGCIVVTRPDQYVAHILRMDQYELISEFFGRFMVPVN